MLTHSNKRPFGRIDREHRNKDKEVTEEEVSKAISDLNKKEASDNNNLALEHFINAKQVLVEPLTMLFQYMQKLHHIPDSMKTGCVTSIPKKNNDPRLPASHRGITIVPVIGKILESVFKDQHSQIQCEEQDDLQLGFTEGLSPLLGALLVTKVIQEAKDSHQVLLIASLDAVKAFDMVVHPILTHTLFEENCPLDIIAAADELYTGLTSSVTWKGYTSSTYSLKQGVRQGGVWSSLLHKS